MCDFIQEQLRKRYLRLSKLPQTALVFFVGKKDDKKEMVQNYCYLNEWTIKNNYLLSLFSDIVENVGMKKVFTKLDLQQGYNNVWIKKGDKWKVVFTTLERSFEPIVIFFGLTNSPAIFQTMMNKILQNLINTGKVASFIDYVIVEMEKEEVVRRLTENDLYIKPEKYKWKVQEVGLLEVVIEPEEIKMKEKKVKGILDWLILKGVKDVQKVLGLVNYY